MEGYRGGGRGRHREGGCNEEELKIYYDTSWMFPWGSDTRTDNNQRRNTKRAGEAWAGRSRLTDPHTENN